MYLAKALKSESMRTRWKKTNRLLNRSEGRKWHFAEEDTVGTGRQHPEDDAHRNQDETLLSTPWHATP